jgi:predicted MFS family arabinose efflux permease
MVVVSVPSLVLRLVEPEDQRIAMALWSAYLPAGAGAMMLLGAIVLPSLSWRVAWLVAAGGSAVVLAMLMAHALTRRALVAEPANNKRVMDDMLEVVSSGGPLTIALCFGAYACCWYTVVGFLPTLQIERLGLSTSTAAIVTAVVTVVNVGGNLAGGWLLQRGVPRVQIIVGATLPMAVCAAGVFLDGLPDLTRLVLAGVYSAVIGAVPAALFTAIAVHVRRARLAGAATGLLMQGSNLGGLIGPPIMAALVSRGGWPAAAWLTSVTLLIVAASGVFLHWRERRKVAA